MAAALRGGYFGAVGRATEWPADRVEAGDWSPVQWYAGGLATASIQLLQSDRLTTAGSLYEFGLLGRNVSHCFEPIKGNPRTHGRLRIFTSIAEESRSTLAGDADEVWQVIPVEKRDKRGGTDAVPKYVNEKGWMLAAQRFRTTSSRTASQYTAEPALGTAYIAIRTDTPDEAKTLNLLWNSTPVLIQLLGMRSKSASVHPLVGNAASERQAAGRGSGSRPRANPRRGTRRTGGDGGRCVAEGHPRVDLHAMRTAGEQP